MKTIDKIIESQEAPKDKNVLWIKGDKLLSHVNGKWTPVCGGSSDNVQGGGGESGGKKIVYLNVVAVRDYLISTGAGDASLRAQLCFGAIALKSEYEEGVCDIEPFAYCADEYRKYTKAVSYIDDVLVYNAEGNLVNSSQMIQQYKSMGAFEITEEEFYNLGA